MCILYLLRRCGTSLICCNDPRRSRVNQCMLCERCPSNSTSKRPKSAPRRDSDDYLFALSAAAGVVMPVIIRPAGGAGVLDRVGGADLLCAMCAWTRCPAASALHSDNSPANTVAATIRERRRAFSPGVMGWAPRTPSMSSMADWGSRIVPPPRVPTSIEGIETEICREPRRLCHVSLVQGL